MVVVAAWVTGARGRWAGQRLLVGGLYDKRRGPRRGTNLRHGAMRGVTGSLRSIIVTAQESLGGQVCGWIDADYGATNTSVRLDVSPEFVCTKNGTNAVPLASNPS